MAQAQHQACLCYLSLKASSQPSRWGAAGPSSRALARLAADTGCSQQGELVIWLESPEKRLDVLWYTARDARLNWCWTTCSCDSLSQERKWKRPYMGSGLLEVTLGMLLGSSMKTQDASWVFGYRHFPYQLKLLDVLHSGNPALLQQGLFALLLCY